MKYKLILILMILGLGVMSCGSGDDSGVKAVSESSDRVFEPLLNADTKEVKENYTSSTTLYSRICGLFGEPTYDKDCYTVDGRNSSSFPEWFGGFYVNTEGSGVLQIQKDYYKDDYEACDWYLQIKPLIREGQKLYYRSCEHSYGELIDSMTAIGSDEGGNEKIGSLGVESIGIDDYNNKISVCLSRTNLEKVKELLFKLVDEKHLVFDVPAGNQ